MKVFMLCGYGDVASDTYQEFADDADAARLIDLRAARALTGAEASSNPPLVFGKVPAAKPSAATK